MPWLQQLLKHFKQLHSLLLLRHEKLVWMHDITIRFAGVRLAHYAWELTSILFLSRNGHAVCIRLLRGQADHSLGVYLFLCCGYPLSFGCWGWTVALETIEGRGKQDVCTYHGKQLLSDTKSHITYYRSYCGCFANLILSKKTILWASRIYTAAWIPEFDCSFSLFVLQVPCHLPQVMASWTVCFL